MNDIEIQLFDNRSQIFDGEIKNKVNPRNFYEFS